MDKVFLMLAAPGMVSKTSAVSAICLASPDVVCLENDILMHEMFARAGLADPANISISETTTWRAEVDAVADCSALVRDLHRDWVARHAGASCFLAEGFMYMLEWYRDAVQAGLEELGYGFEFWALRYGPPMDEQVSRRIKKYAHLGWAESRNFHAKELRKEWLKFEPPSGINMQYECVDDGRLRHLIKQTIQ